MHEPRPRRHDAASPPLLNRWSIALIVALVLMVLVGGGSAQAPIEQLIAETIGLGLLVLPLWRTRWRMLVAQDRLVVALVVALVALFAAQLIALPATLWSAWPGRALYAAGDRLMAGYVPARPWSLAPDETVAALVFLVPALAMALRAREGGRFAEVWIIAWLIALALSGALALVQTGAAPGTWHIYANAHSDLPTGTFANRNHQGIAMLCGIALAAALQRLRRPDGMWLFVVAATGCTMGTLITGSRTAVALLIPALVLGSAIAFGHRLDRRQGRTIALAAAGGVVVLVLTALLIAKVQPGGALASVLSRSYTADDERYHFWPVVLRMIAQSWPWGIGIGSFRRAYEGAEPGDLLSPLYLNHAHNDWFEWTLETGLAGVVLAAAFLVWLFLRWLPAWRRHGGDPLKQAAGSVIVLLLAHSAVDYPIRTVALSGLFGMAVGVLARPVRRRGDAPAPLPPLPRVLSPRGAVVAAIALLALIQIGATQGGMIAQLGDQPALAAGLPNAHARNDGLQAWQRAVSGAAPGLVRQLALRANAQSPLDEPAFAAMARVSPPGAARDALIDHAARLSRRDPWLLQALFDRARAQGDARGEVDALAAMINLQVPVGRAREDLAADLARPAVFAATLAALHGDPRWRHGLFAELTPDAATAPAVGRLIGALGAAHEPLTADDMAGLLTMLLYHGHAEPALADAMWRAWRGTADPWDWPAVDDGGPLMPFDWHFAPRAEIVDTGHGRALQVGERDLVTAPVAARMTWLPAGTWRFVAQPGPGLAPEAIRATLLCDGQSTGLDNGAVWTTPHACARAELRLIVISTEGTVLRAELRAVSAQQP